MLNKKHAFKDSFAFLSNMQDCDIIINPADVAQLQEEFPSLDIKAGSFKNSESLYVAFKTSDISVWNLLSEKSGSFAKKLGRDLELVENWDEIKLEVMRLAIKLKFDQNKWLANKLIETGTIQLVEYNWWKDTFWGVCNGKGENHLGQLLMAKREELKSTRKLEPKNSEDTFPF